MSTSRCTQCHAPLSDSLSVTCDYCGEKLSDGFHDWVVQEAFPFEAWNVRQAQRVQADSVRERLGYDLDDVLDPHERERLLYMMAALAAADGQVTSKELSLLKMCSDRWGVPWANVQTALKTGPQMFDQLIPKATAEATRFLKQLVNMALVDGRIDAQERRMLTEAARHLGVSEQLQSLIDPKQRLP
jgi:uncharacterized membrane protein YebE (DUF533 family)